MTVLRVCVDVYVFGLGAFFMLWLNWPDESPLTTLGNVLAIILWPLVLLAVLICGVCRTLTTPRRRT